MERLKTKVSSHACSPVDHVNNYKDILDEILKDNDCEVSSDDDDDEVVGGKVKDELRVQI